VRITSFHASPRIILSSSQSSMTMWLGPNKWPRLPKNAEPEARHESYPGFASFTFGDLSPRAREELTERGFKIYDRQRPGQPIGFAPLGGMLFYCPIRFRIGHLNCRRVQVGAEDFALEETALGSGTLTRNGLLNLSSGRHPGHPRSPRSVFRYGFLSQYLLCPRTCRLVYQ
jgi:hypothetical protein